MTAIDENTESARRRAVRSPRAPLRFAFAGRVARRLLLAACCTAASSAFAVDFELKDQVLLTDIDNATNNGRLGSAVALADGLVVMGAPFKSPSGAAYVFRIDEDRELDFGLEFNAQSPIRYGSSTVISRNLLAIGNDASDEPIEIYERSGDSYAFSTLVPEPVLSGITIRTWGPVLDLDEDRLIVGDASANVDGVGNAGIVIIFRRDLGGPDNWGVEGVLRDPSPGDRTTFGRAVAIGENTAVVGDSATERALLFQRVGDTWTFSKQLEPLDTQDDDNFGTSVAAEGDYLAVGATNGNNAALPTNSGSVHIFERNLGGANNFGQVAEVVGSDAEFIDEFGENIRLRRSILSVGSPGANRAYLFRLKDGVWQEETVIAPPAVPFGNANFGSAVDYRRGTLIVGADNWDDTSRDDRFGAVFLYEYDLIRRCGGEFDVTFCDTFEDDF